MVVWSLALHAYIDTDKQRKRAKRYTLEDVLDLVPASDAQIEAALSARRILEIEGKPTLLYRLVC